MSSAVAYDDIKPDMDMAKKMPAPVGYYLLIALPEMRDKTEGGIVIPEERQQLERVASIVGYVLKAGPDAYKDKVKFPTGPWCEEGDWVVLNRAYLGTRVTIHGSEFRLINDDSVAAVVENPMGISRTE